MYTHRYSTAIMKARTYWILQMGRRFLFRFLWPFGLALQVFLLQQLSLLVVILYDTYGKERELYNVHECMRDDNYRKENVASRNFLLYPGLTVHVGSSYGVDCRWAIKKGFFENPTWTSTSGKKLKRKLSSTTGRN